MPNRIVREGINSSARINSLTPAAELFYRRLILVVDDYGRFHASPATLRGACWPTCPDRVSEEDIIRWLIECAHTSVKLPPLIRMYEVDGCKYLEVVDFRQQIRSKSKFPEPDVNCLADATQLLITRRSRISESEAKADSEFVARAQPPAAAAPSPDSQEKFEAFWKRYPVKDGKPIAWGVWVSLVSPQNESKVFACLERYLASDRAARSPKNANNWLHDCARDGWDSDWPKPHVAPTRPKNSLGSLAADDIPKPTPEQELDALRWIADNDPDLAVREDAKRRLA